MAKRPSMRDPETPMSAFGTVVLREPTQNATSAFLNASPPREFELKEAQRKAADTQVRGLFPQARIWHLHARPRRNALKGITAFIASIFDLDLFRIWFKEKAPRAFYLVDERVGQLLVRVTDADLEAIALPTPPAPVTKRRFTLGQDAFLREEELA